jgi:hypothetical protein
MNRTLLASLTIKVAEKSMDMMLRAAILGGAAGVLPKSWLGSGDMMHVTKALSRAEDLMPNLNPIWVARQETGLHRALERVVKSTLKNDDRADEIVMDIVAGFSTSSKGKAPHGWPYSIGQHLAEEIKAGGDLKHALGILLQHGKHRALQEKRKKTEESLSMDTDEGGMKERELPTEVNEDKLLDIVMGDPAIRQLYLETVQDRFSGTKRSKEIVDFWLDNPRAKNVEISEALGIPMTEGGGATLVGRVLNQARDAFMSRVKTDPKVQNALEMAIDRAKGGFGIRAKKKHP